MSEKTSMVRHPSTLRSNPTPTEEEVFSLLSDLRQIFIQYKKEVPGKRKPWPESIRERILKLWALGVTNHQISSESGVPAQTLYSWRQRLKKQGATTGFTEILITRSKRRSNFQIQQDESRHSSKHQLSQLVSSAMMPTHSAIIVTLPNGIRIEGLCYEQVREMVQELEMA